jgi:hypothetical protein
MSENIQSIANGSFVLGNTSATTFEAGNGISITQPSEGTVRISNDETVLWSGNTFSIGDGSHLSATVQLSEPISAFEEIKIISSGNLDSETIILDTSKRGGNGAFTWIVPEGSNSNWIGLRGVFTDQTHLKVYGGYSTTLASVFTGNGWWSYKNIYKVVGINRISGSNT